MKTFDGIEIAIRESYLEDHEKKTHLFRTLTLFYNKDGYKIAVRYAGDFSGINLSSQYQETLEKAFKSFVKEFKEYQKDGGLKGWKLHINTR